MAEPTAPLLDFDTLIDRARIRIDGECFELRRREEFSIVEDHRYPLLASRLDARMHQAELTDAEGKEIAAVLDAMCRMVLDAPDAVHQKLRDSHRLSILVTFAMLPPVTPTPGPAEATITPHGVSTGAN